MIRRRERNYRVVDDMGLELLANLFNGSNRISCVAFAVTLGEKMVLEYIKLALFWDNNVSGDLLFIFKCFWYWKSMEIKLF